MRRRIGAAVAAVTVLVVALVVARPAAAGSFVFGRLLPLLSGGYAVQTQAVRHRSGEIDLLGVRLTRGGLPVLDASRVAVRYRLRDLLPGSTHRFGLLGITVVRPHIWLIRRADGSFNVAIPRGGRSGGPSRPVRAAPLSFDLRVVDGAATLLDRERFYRGSRRQQIGGITVDAHVDSSRTTTYTVTGHLDDGGPQPFRIAGMVDAASGVAMHHITMRAIPIKTIANYFINSSAAQVLGGTIRGMDMRAWGFAAPGAAMAYQFSGSGYLAGGQIDVRSLDSPIRNLSGRITLFDSGFAAKRLTASVGHIPIAVAGGIFDFAHPQFRLGVDGNADLRNLKDVVHFAEGLPIRGRVRLRAVIEGDISMPVLLIGFTGTRFYYGAVPIDQPNGAVALYNSHLIVLPFHGFYDGMRMHVAGDLALAHQTVSDLVLHAAGSSSRIPYLSGLIAPQTVVVDALLHGVDLKIGARGFIDARKQPSAVAGFFQESPTGIAAFGPIAVRAAGGGDLEAGFDLDRPHGNSAFWISARNIRLNEPMPVTLPGVDVPQLPPFDARIVDANVVATGSSKNAVIGGRVYLTNAQIAGVPFNAIAARFAGPFAQSSIDTLHADGPWGSFDGNGAFGPTAIVARGGYSGTLQGLHQFFGTLPASGEISGPMAIAIAGSRIYVQARGASLRHATIHGFPVSGVSGTMAYAGGKLEVLNARASAGGGEIVAAGTIAASPSAGPALLALATTPLRASALRQGFGVPLDGGTLRAVGTMSPGGAIPGLDAGVVLQNGRAAGYGPFMATADVTIADDAMHLSHTIAAFGTTYAHVGGSILDLAAGVPHYALNAQIPVGRIAPLAALASVPTYHADGSFDGALRVGGSGLSPQVNGLVNVPVGSINGLGFADAHARIAVGRGEAAARNGSVLVGTTRVAFSAAVSRAGVAVALRSTRARLSDFNDFFDTGDTLGGQGRVAFSLANYGRVIYTNGDVDIADLRYRRFPIGNTVAKWSSLRNAVRETLEVGGPSGVLDSRGTIGFARSADIAGLVRHSSYDINATLRGFDLGTWMPLLGFGTVPVTGRVNGSAQISGSVPNLDVAAQAELTGGTLGPLPIERASFALRSRGERMTLTNASFALPALEAEGSGSFGITPASPVDLHVHAVTGDLSQLVAEVSKKRLNVTGVFESTLSVTGSFSHPHIAAGVDGTNVQAEGLRIPSFVGALALRGNDVELSDAEINLARGRLMLAGTLPLRLSPLAFGPLDAPFAMDIAAQGVDLAPFGSLLGNGTLLGGTLDGHIGLSGSVRNPRVYGRIALSGVRYQSALETVPITRTAGQLTFDGTSANFGLSARLGAGTLTGSGGLSFAGGLEGGPLTYHLTARANGAQLSMPAFGSATIDADVALVRRNAGLSMLSGRASIDQATIPLSAFLAFSGGGASGAGPPKPPFNLGFDLGITASSGVTVRGGAYGFAMDIPATGAARLTGSLLGPKLDGKFQANGGTLTFVDRLFRLEQATVSFDPSDGVLPSIYAVGTTHVTNPDPNVSRNPTGSTDIQITVSGRVNPGASGGSAGLKMALSSTPPGYTQQQLLALLLPLNALAGPIQFTDTSVILPSNVTALAGAPNAGTGALLPNVLIRRENGTLTVGQEAFNILSAQFSGSVLSPLESLLGNELGFSDLNFTVDYTGNFGLSLRRLLGRNVYAIYGTTFGVPVRQTFGFAYQPNASTSAQFSMFVQQGPTPLFLSPEATLSTNPRAAAGQALQGANGFTFLYERLF